MYNFGEECYTFAKNPGSRVEKLSNSPAKLITHQTFRIMDNKVQIVVPSEKVDTASQKIAEIDALFPGTLSLTADERRGGMKLGEKSLSFVSKGVEFMLRSPEFNPNFLDVPEAQRDFEAAQNLFAVGRQLQILADKINDTAMQAGIEAMAAVMSYYNNVKLASKQGVAGARTIYDDLSVRFPGRGRSNPEPTQTPE